MFVGDVLTTGLYGCAIGGVRPGDSVAVIGAGPVGFFSVQAARMHGAKEVISLDLDEERLSLAEEAGARPVNVRARNPEMAVSELTDGRGADVVIEAVGNASAFETAVDVVRRGGTVCVLGMYVGEQTRIPLGVYWSRALNIVFAGICPVHSWWDRALQAVVDGDIDPLPIISHRLPLAQAVRGYQLFESHRATKVVLEP